MRVLFFGTTPFAVPTLAALLASPRHTVLGVVTQPDRASGRGLQMQTSAVKRAAQAARPELAILQPERARRKEFVEQVAAIDPDALVVAAFGQILSQRLLDLPRYGGVNVHGSLLPRWRGAAPMQYALMAGDAETGVTTMQMDAGMDTGDILLQAPLAIGAGDTTETLEHRLGELGAPLLLETLERLERGECPRTVQDPALVTYSPPLPAGIGVLDWRRPAAELARLVRGVTPRPGAWTGYAGKRLKVWSAQDAGGSPPGAAEPGEVIFSNASGLTVAAAPGTALRLEQVQPEGKPRMAAADWARGARVTAGARLEGGESAPPAE